MVPKNLQGVPKEFTKTSKESLMKLTFCDFSKISLPALRHSQPALCQLSASPPPALWQNCASSRPAHLETKQQRFFCQLSPSSQGALRELSASSPPALRRLIGQLSASSPPCQLSNSSLPALLQLPNSSPLALRHSLPLSASSLPAFCNLFASSSSPWD